MILLIVICILGGHLVIMGNALYINKLFENILLSYDYTIL